MIEAKLQLNSETIPKELTTLPQWVVYRRVWNKERGKFDKIPYQINGNTAKTNDPSTWTTFENALNASNGGEFDGIGFVFTKDDPYCGVDLDSFFDQAGTIKKEMQKYITLLNSYTEHSPSATGLHIIVKSKLPKGGRKKGNVECYDAGRFFTVTGKHLQDTPLTIESRQEELETFHLEIFGQQRPGEPIGASSAASMSEDEIIAKAKSAKNGDKFSALWGGNADGYDSPSEADLALCSILAYWANKDLVRVDRLFRQSGLMRPKWDEKHLSDGSTYGQMTLQKTISICSLPSIDSFQGDLDSPPMSLSALINSKDIPPVEYYVHNMVQKKGRTMLSAATGMYKTMFIQNLVLALTTGVPYFISEEFIVSPARVLLLDLEIGYASLKDRFKAMHPTCDANTALFIKSTPGIDLLDTSCQRQIEKWLKELNIEVLVIDPIGDAWTGDENVKQDVDRLTRYLNGLIFRFKISIIIVHHWRKSSKGFKSGGQMAAGSYRWEGWLENHITLSGDAKRMTVSSEKSRNRIGYRPFIIKLNPNTLLFEYIGEYGITKKVTDETLLELHNSLGGGKVSIPKMIKEATKRKLCSAGTVRTAIYKSTIFKIDESSKTHYITRG